MTGKLNALPNEQFISIWNAASTLEEAVEKMQGRVGKPCPRWAVMARAVSCRKEGMELKALERTAKAA